MHGRYVTNKQAISCLLLFSLGRSRCQNFPNIKNEMYKGYSKNNRRLIDCKAKWIQHCTKPFIFELQKSGFDFTVAFISSLALADLSRVVGKLILELCIQTSN